VVLAAKEYVHVFTPRKAHLFPRQNETPHGTEIHGPMRVERTGGNGVSRKNEIFSQALGKGLRGVERLQSVGVL
jgi:hypothetical protein